MEVEAHQSSRTETHLRKNPAEGIVRAVLIGEDLHIGMIAVA